MKRLFFTSLAALLIAAQGGTVDAAGPRSHRIARTFSQQTPWHGDYYNVQQGGPVALVVPPTAASMTHLSWGVAQSEVRPLYPQYGRGHVPGAMPGSVPSYRATPWWPSHTDQFGIYPARGPWR
jgi:hypothetical protein